MHLNRVEIDNFRVIRRATIDFPESVIAIVGPNGAGKSSIIEAITWVLYGFPAARTSESGIKATFASKDEPCRVSLEFSINDDRYRIERRLVGRSEKAEVALFRNSVSESIGVRETVQYIGGLLGLDFRGFRTSFLARQQELNALSDLVPSQRQNHLAGMLGIERLDKIIARVKEDTKLAKEKTVVLEEQIGRWSQATTRVDELTVQIEKLMAEKERAERTARSARETLDQASAALKEQQDLRSDWLLKKGTLASEEKSLKEIDERHQRSLQELEALSRDRGSLAGAERELADFNAVVVEFEKLRKSQEEVNRKEALAKRLRDEETIRAKTEKDLVRAVESERKLNSELEQIPDDVDSQKHRAAEELERARQHYADLNAAQKNRRAEIDSLKGQIDGIETLGGRTVCDRCGRPFGDDLDSIRKHLKGEIDKLNAELRSAESNLKAAEQNGAEKRRLDDRLAEQIKRRSELKGRLNGAAEAGKQLQNSLEQVTKRCTDLKNEIAALGEVSFDSVALVEARGKKERLENLQKEAAQLRGRLERLPQVEKEIKESDRRQRETAKRIAELKATLKKIGFNEDRFMRTTADLETAQQNHERCRDSLVEVDQKLKLLTNDLQTVRKQSELLEKSKAEAETLKGDHYYGEKITRLMTDFRKHVIARIRPTLASFAGDLVRQMTADKYSLVELDEQYNLRLMDSGEFYDIERFSGGEKDLANLCLRLAISQALTESAGMHQSFIILDEVFGSQDTERRQLIVEALAGLRQSFNQIILITHIEEIKDSVENLIIVRPTGEGWSEVIAGGNDHGAA